MIPDFDIDLLRTFVAIAERGGFARAGAVVGRTQSTVSLQMKRLEGQAGATLFRREGRRMALTAGGRALLHYARRILALNDEAKASLQATGIEGPVRFGTVQDLAEAGLPGVLARFAMSYPATRLEVRVDASAALGAMIEDGALDLALVVGTAPRRAQALGREQPVWIGNGRVTTRIGEPVALVLCDEPCGYRAAILEALERARMPYRIAVTSPSLTGLRAAVRAGLGITARGARALTEGLVALQATTPMPPLPAFQLALIRADEAASPAVERLAALLAEGFSDGPI